MMKTYAFINMGVVWEIIPPTTDDIPIEKRYTADFCKQCADITGVTPTPRERWIATKVSGSWMFQPPSSPTAPGVV